MQSETITSLSEMTFGGGGDSCQALGKKFSVTGKINAIVILPI